VVEEKTSRVEEEINERIKGLVNEDHDIDLDHIILKIDSKNDTDITYVDSKLSLKDKVHTVLARVNPNRTKFRIKPGLYAMGNPNEESEVLVTSNYKLTFDTLRRELEGVDCYILVLNTHGVNVWCAAGKGTFSSAELSYRVNKHNVKNVVRHKRLILPQLGASTMNMVDVRKHCKMNIVYGPVRASDIKNFLLNNLECSREERNVTFNLVDRLVLIPVDFISNFKWVLYAFILSLLFNMVTHGFDQSVIMMSATHSIPYLMALVFATVIFPILLPIIPFKAFSLKGMVLSIPLVVYLSINSELLLMSDILASVVVQLILIASLVTFLSLNFTGTTNFTSFSGVKIETKYQLNALKILVPLSFVALFLSMIWGGL
jgi:hypothetical protein